LNSADRLEQLNINLNFIKSDPNILATTEIVRRIDDIVMERVGMKHIIGEDYFWAIAKKQ